MYPAHIIIDRAALRHNLKQVAVRTPCAGVMAVVKANAYNHGDELVSNALNSVQEFASNTIAKVQEMREQGIDQPVTLLTSQLSCDDLGLCADLNARPVIYDATQIKALTEVSNDVGLDIWLKVDTGMGRLGFLPSQLPDALSQLKALPAVRSISLMSHFANADDRDHPLNQQQIALFNELASQYQFKQLSLNNSAGVINFPDQQHDLVRPGIMLYGASPTKVQTAAELNLQPVMSFRSRIIAIKELPTGHSVGYGSTYACSQATKVGIIQCGYGDGYPRHAPTGTPVFIAEKVGQKEGQIVPLVGRVSMDMITVDLSQCDVAQVGSEVELWGQNLAVDDVAGKAGTISYELLCGITERVERKVV